VEQTDIAERLEEIVSPILEWYDANARLLPWRENRDPYRIWVSEIMLQQTRVEAAKPYYERFMERLPTVQHLAAAEDEELYKLWEGLGYYSRVRNLKKAAQIICREYGGRFPEIYGQVLALPGIGEYTAGAILSIAFEQPEPAVDGNVLRVFSRLFADPLEGKDSAVKKRVTGLLRDCYPLGRCGDFTQSLMELGALICLPNGAPKCEECPLRGLCAANREGSWSLFPPQIKKAPRKLRQMTVLLLWSGEKLALRKREEKGVLSGMWELPNLEGYYSREELQGWLEEQGLCPGQITPAAPRKHIFTHLEWQMQSFCVSCGKEGEGFLWVDRETLEREYSLPTAFRKFLDSTSQP